MAFSAVGVLDCRPSGGGGTLLLCGGPVIGGVSASALVCLGTAAVAVRGCTSVGVVRVVGVSGGIIPL